MRDQYGEEDLQDVADADEGDIVGDRIEGQLAQVGFCQELEVFESDEWGGEEPVTEIELRESEVYACHGEIVVDDKINKAGDQKEEKKPVLLELLAKAVLTIENSLTTLQRFAQEISGSGEKKYDINDWRAGVSANPCVCVGIHHKANGRQGIEKRE